MKIYLTSYYSGAPGEPGPGSIIDVDDTEAARIIDAGGARELTDAEKAALPEDPKPAPKSKSKG